MALARNVVASAARTTSGDSGALSLERRNGQKLSLMVDITAVGIDVDETLDLTVEWSHDGTLFAPGETTDVFTQLTQPQGVQAVVKQFDVKAPQYRVVWTIAGTTPSFTFSIDETIT